MRAQKRATGGVRRHYQIRCRAVGEGGQGRRHFSGLSSREHPCRPVPAYIGGLSGAGPKEPMPFSAILRRIRSISLSIGQLTFASFMLLLAMIVITSVASVVSIRHIDSTFAELQRLQSLGDLAEEIDRRMNELRLAARDFVTDPAAPSSEV